jgi:DNA-3-methyladenine glycosylase I
MSGAPHILYAEIWSPTRRSRSRVGLPRRTGEAISSGSADPRGDLGVKEVVRCPWARNELAIRYHDEEWGVPVHQDGRWFEFLTLEGAQAGLSWDTILRKRENYRKAFAGFDPARVAKFNSRKIASLLGDAGIVRNRLKINSTIGNAKAFVAIQKEFGSFDEYIWGLVGGRPRINAWRSLKQVPARTIESDAMSKELIWRGFKFVGSTICYAMMQATGMVNDHLVDCVRYKAVSRAL